MCPSIISSSTVLVFVSTIGADSTGLPASSLFGTDLIPNANAIVAKTPESLEKYFFNLLGFFAFFIVFGLFASNVETCSS